LAVRHNPMPNIPEWAVDTILILAVVGAGTVVFAALSVLLWAMTK
jgi:hypothetical protein